MKITRLIKTLFFASAIAAPAMAVPINGSIGFSGAFTTDNADFSLATAFTSFSDVRTVGISDGTYAAVPSNTAPVTFSAFSFAAPSITPLWTFVHLGITYSFDATTVIVDKTSSTITAQGSGIAKVTGFDNTVGIWIITANKAGTNLSFSASTSVPDGGTTALLLGAGLIALSLFAIRLKPARI